MRLRRGSEVAWWYVAAGRCGAPRALRTGSSSVTKRFRWWERGRSFGAGLGCCRIQRAHAGIA